MGKRTEHAPGTFSWVDLSTTDLQAGKAFYTGLFGWEFEDMPAGEGMVYSMATLDGDYVAAASAQMEMERDQGVPPHWNNYVTVADADATAAKAKELGANVLLEAFDVLDSGRMAVFADPTGAVLSIWQPNQHIGAGVVNVPGAFTWNELHTGDVDAAASFYGDLFGWATESMPTGEDGPRYDVISNNGRSNGGIMNAQPEEPPNWLPYFAVESLEETMAKAKDSGGHVHAGPIPMPQGRIAVLQDPQGAFFALWEGPLDD